MMILLQILDFQIFNDDHEVRGRTLLRESRKRSANGDNEGKQHRTRRIRIRDQEKKREMGDRADQGLRKHE